MDWTQQFGPGIVAQRGPKMPKKNLGAFIGPPKGILGLFGAFSGSPKRILGHFSAPNGPHTEPSHRMASPSLGGTASLLAKSTWWLRQ